MAVGAARTAADITGRQGRQPGQGEDGLVEMFRCEVFEQLDMYVGVEMADGKLSPQTERDAGEGGGELEVYK